MMQVNSFNLLLDLLNIENQPYYVSFPEWMAQQLSLNKKILFFHRYGVIFQAYADLCNSKISLEEFFKVGDIDSCYLLNDCYQTRMFLNLWYKDDFPADSAIVFDEKLFMSVFPSLVQKQIVDNLHKKNSILQLYP